VGRCKIFVEHYFAVYFDFVFDGDCVGGLAKGDIVYEPG